MDTVHTNIVMCDISDTKMTANELSLRLKEKGIKINGGNTTSVRFVTHHWIHKDDIQKVLDAVRLAIKNN